MAGSYRIYLRNIRKDFPALTTDLFKNSAITRANGGLAPESSGRLGAPPQYMGNQYLQQQHSKLSSGGWPNAGGLPVSYYPNGAPTLDISSLIPTREHPVPPAPMQYDTFEDKFNSILQRISDGERIDAPEILDVAKRGLPLNFFSIHQLLVRSHEITPEISEECLDQLLCQGDEISALKYYEEIHGAHLLSLGFVRRFFLYQLSHEDSEHALMSLRDYVQFGVPTESELDAFYRLCRRRRDYASALSLFDLPASLPHTTETFESLFELARETGEYGAVPRLFACFRSSSVPASPQVYRSVFEMARDARSTGPDALGRALDLLESLLLSSSPSSSPLEKSSFVLTDDVYSPLCEAFLEEGLMSAMTRLQESLYSVGRDLSERYLSRLPELYRSEPQELLRLLRSRLSLGLEPSPLLYHAIFLCATRSGVSSSSSLSVPAVDVWDESFGLFLSLATTRSPLLRVHHYAAIIESAIAQQRWDAVQRVIRLYEDFPQSRSDLLPWETILRACKRCEKAQIYYSRLQELCIAPSSSIYQSLYQMGVQSRNPVFLQSLVDEWHRNHLQSSESSAEGASLSSSESGQWLSTVLNHGVDSRDERSVQWASLVRQSPATADTTIALMNYYSWRAQSSLDDCSAAFRGELNELLSQNLQHAYSIGQYGQILEICKCNGLFELGLRYHSLLRSQSLPQTKSVVSTVFSLYKELNDWEGALSYFQDRKSEEGMNNHLYLSMMALCKAYQAWPMAKDLIYELMQGGIKPSNSIQSSVLSLYRECGQYEEARQLYEDLLKPSPEEAGGAGGGKVAPVVHGCMISILGDQGRFGSAMEIYESIKRNKEEVGNSTFCALFHNCAKERNYACAMELYSDFLGLGIEHNTHIYSSLMLVCEETGHPEKVSELLLDMERRGVPSDEYVQEIRARCQAE